MVGGDAKEPGDYPDGLSLLRAMAEIGHPLAEIGIPAYPQGHAFIPDAPLLDALRAKAAFASYMTTQLCFDPVAIVSAGLSSLRGDGRGASTITQQLVRARLLDPAAEPAAGREATAPARISRLPGSAANTTSTRSTGSSIRTSTSIRMPSCPRSTASRNSKCRPVSTRLNLGGRWHK